MRTLMVLLLLVTGPLWAATGEQLLQQRCAGCHDLQGPAAGTLKELWQRKGPDLFYAGVKYRAQWLRQWLQNPRRIRPAGYLYFQHIKPGEKHDVIDTSTLSEHMALSADEAEKVTAALMARKAAPVQLKGDEFAGGSISITFGEMVFDKFNGCMACHEIEPGYGGLSGPEVYTAAKRMQPDYLVSFIRDPQAWNPKTPMPNKHISEINIQKIVRYFQALAKENWDEK